MLHVLHYRSSIEKCQKSPKLSLHNLQLSITYEFLSKDKTILVFSEADWGEFLPLITFFMRAKVNARDQLIECHSNM